MRKSRKLIAILATLALLATLLVPMVGPASAATENRVSTVPVIADDAKNQPLGVLTFKEDSDFPSDLVAGRTFTITFPSGVKIKNTFDTVQNFVYWSNSGNSGGAYTELNVANVKKTGDYTVDITLPSGINDNVDAIQIRPIVDIDGFAGGDIEVTVEGFDSGITGGKFVLGRVAGGDTTATAIEVKTIGESGQGGAIRITENAVGAIGNGVQKITIKLPAKFKWDSRMDSSEISFLGGLSGSVVTATKVDGRTFEFTFDPVDSRAQRGIIQIDPWIVAEDGANYGDVEVSISGDKIDDADLVIAKYVDFGVTVKADGDPEEVLAGQFDSELTKIYIKENVDNSLIANRKTKIEFPNWVKITDVDVTDAKNISDPNTGDGKSAENSFEDVIKADIDGTSNEVEFVIPDGNGKTEFKLKFTVSIKANASGDIVAKVSGRGGVEGEVLVGKALTPVTVTSEAKDIKVGVKGQPIGDIIITETKKEALAEGNLIVELPDGVEWSSDPVVEVIEGNVDIDTDGIDTNDNVLTIPIDNASTKPSKIKISGAKVDLDRTIPEGTVEASIKGDAVVANDKSKQGWLFGTSNPGSDGSATALDEGEFDQSSCAKVVVANVVTPAPGEKTATVVFKVSDTKFTVNGVEQTMDVAPYVKNGRTYVPVRYSAQAVGVAPENILYSGGKVTLIKGDKVVQFTIGSNVMLINGVAVTMDVKAEVTNGRTMLPFRWVAQALGANVDWDPNSQAVTMTL
ncbi:copper amine oxidase N-terminal domain-containing protein [Desulfofundulus thermosubterraneus]|uniref:Copper amine oxidase N-terminal domain-containing protein n=1 Tax=Desulfofundulus thermosubterraneus DSM 16057 TaxID=1121432 RepID=A0A1M6HRF6_9FIRM|nr:copper amine oxidase N-terminal domain-containing protein [Desulfofundulus thermosubterraneus]SHJ24771.1 Copper amine oxidase N-terminal domain-containing protein [Desulfofundulus thermosubterraneus DSM 16057]